VGDIAIPLQLVKSSQYISQLRRINWKTIKQLRKKYKVYDNTKRNENSKSKWKETDR